MPQPNEVRNRNGKKSSSGCSLDMDAACGDISFTIPRYSRRPFFARFYLVGFYILPISLVYSIELSLFCVFLSFFLFLSTYWTISSELLLYYKDSKGRYALFDKIEMISRQHINDEETVEYCFNNRMKYIIEGDRCKKIVPKIGYKIGEYIDYYRSSGTDNKIDFFREYALYPDNSLVFPTPSFLPVFISQCTTPIFTFQMFSSLLMIFDEYVLQSVFSAVMNIGVEAMMAFGRVQTMKLFKGMGKKEGVVEILHKPAGLRRDGHATASISSLKTGDVFVISNAGDIPCDCLIMSGSCIVNESMLSGESTPLLKSSVSSSTTERELDINVDKRHVLFSGTTIIKINEDSTGGNGRDTSALTCIAIRTGFNTEQGSLLSKMLQSDSSYDFEALKFVLILSANALIASVFTYFNSSKSGRALFLDLIILFTNAIPFELPMEMGISIQMAIRALLAKNIYCLEPFRVALAGKVEVCCFDKTGTLTSTELKLEEIVDCGHISNDDHVDKTLLFQLLNCCNELVEIDGKLQGDPIDMEIHKHISNGTAIVGDHSVKMVFPFSSELRKQAVVAAINGIDYYIVKGAPEQLYEAVANKKNYGKYEEYAKKGFRVIALAHCKVSSVEEAMKIHGSRSGASSQLIWDAFILFGSNIKHGAVEMVKTLMDSGHKVVVITGDNLLTAANVCGLLGIHAEGVEGEDITDAIGSPEFMSYNLFARADPKQKELIIKEYKRRGFTTMMVGDGTNDVGALKLADVGIAVIPVSEDEKRKSADSNSVHTSSSTAGKNGNTMDSVLDSLVSVKIGDASVAAPFSVKSNSLTPIIDIIQQGRSSAVTTIQMYKIIALNSIISAFTMGSLDLLGIKFTEKQMLSVGILQSVAFNAISSSKIIQGISKERVIESIFTKYIIVSIIGQSIVHIGSYYILFGIIRGSGMAGVAELGSSSPDTARGNNFINSSVFILTVFQSIATFIANYIGRPFREDISENTSLLLSLLGMTLGGVNCIINVHEELNGMLEIVDLGENRNSIVLLCASVLALTYFIEKICVKLFLQKKSIKIQ